ncbi:hypothetical protein HYU06_04140 [Candidatus Woesearchaeota archaeon]|nr:hypothetical protein [Candidatus Woesearchaeota archaeon]
MQVFEAKPKEWGNSLGITIPSDIVKNEHLSTKMNMKVIIIGEEMQQLKKAFGTLKLKKPTQQVMDEIDEGYD